MTWRLRRYHHEGDSHLITFSCYKRLPYLGSVKARDCFERSLEAARLKHGFSIYAYVVMPEHVHLLVSECGDLSMAMHAVKLSVAKQLPERPFWTPRFHGFNVFNPKKFAEKVDYIHENPAARGLVPLAEMWRWSSLPQYLGKTGVITVSTGRSDAPDQYDWSNDPGARPEGEAHDRTHNSGAPPSARSD